MTVYFSKEHLYYFALLNTALNGNIQYTIVSLVALAPSLRRTSCRQSIVSRVQVNGEGKVCEKVSWDLLEHTVPDTVGH